MISVNTSGRAFYLVRWHVAWPMNSELLSMVFCQVLRNYRVIIEQLSAVSPYIFANCCSVGRFVVTSSSREAEVIHSPPRGESREWGSGVWTTCLRLLRRGVSAGARTHDPWIASQRPYRLATAPCCTWQYFCCIFSVTKLYCKLVQPIRFVDYLSLKKSIWWFLLFSRQCLKLLTDDMLMSSSIKLLHL